MLVGSGMVGLSGNNFVRKIIKDKVYHFSSFLPSQSTDKFI